MEMGKCKRKGEEDGGETVINTAHWIGGKKGSSKNVLPHQKTKKKQNPSAERDQGRLNRLTQKSILPPDETDTRRRRKGRRYPHSGVTGPGREVTRKKQTQAGDTVKGVGIFPAGLAGIGRRRERNSRAE